VLHTVYKALPIEDVDRIIAYCRERTIEKGGVFEVYPDGLKVMVVVNSRPENEPLEKFLPLGAFYCNYLGPGIISLEEEEPHHDGMPSAQSHIKAIKQTLETLIATGRGANEATRREANEQ
jgi:hypothetical protein